MIKDYRHIGGRTYSTSGPGAIVPPAMTYYSWDGVPKETRGEKFFELSNHLGNVLSVVSDRKLPVDDGLGTVAYYQPDVVSYSDYYPFGMQLDSRHASSGGYRYGFNGMEKDNEIKGSGNSYDFGARIYDARIGRWLSSDPMAKSAPGWSPYRAFFDSPLIFKDPDGKYEFLTIVIIDERTGTKVAFQVENAISTQVMTDGATVIGSPGLTYTYSEYYDFETTMILRIDKEGKAALEIKSKVLEQRGVKDRDIWPWEDRKSPGSKKRLAEKGEGFRLPGFAFYSKNGQGYGRKGSKEWGSFNIDGLLDVMSTIRTVNSANKVLNRESTMAKFFYGNIKSKVIGSGLEAVFKEVYELLEEMEDKSGSTRSVGEGTGQIDYSWDTKSIDEDGNEWHINSKTKDTIYGYPKKVEGVGKSPTLKCKPCEEG